MSSAKIDSIKVGSVVTVSLQGSKRVFRIVEPNGIDPLQGYISCNAPVAQCVLGKEVGYSGSLTLPSGENVTLTILKAQ